MAQYKEDEQYITGGAIDDTPEPVPEGLLKMFSPETVASVSTGTWQQNELERYESPLTGPAGLIEPITTIPGLSQISRALGNAARAIDEILPTTSLDPYIPNVETIANFTPGVGDIETGEYSALDMLGVGLDALGLGAAAKIAKGKKAAQLPLITDLDASYARLAETSPTQEAIELIPRGTNQAALEVSPRYNRVIEIREGGEESWTQAVRQMRDEMGTPGTGTPYDQAARQRILDRNAEARANLEGEVIRPYEPSPEIRAELDAIGAPSNEAFARMNAEIEAGVIPEGIVDALPGSELARIDEAGSAATRIEDSLGNIKYENFNIDQLDLFGNLEMGGRNIRKRFFRDDRSKTNVIVDLTPTGNPDQIMVKLTEGGKANPAGQIDTMDDVGRSYFKYNITRVGDISKIHDIMFFAKGKGIRPQFESSRLLRDAIDHAPKNAVLDEQQMTMDALYATLKEMVRRPKATFNIDPTKVKYSKSSTGVSESFSRPAKLAKEGKADEMIQMFAELEQKLIKQGKIKPGEGLGLEVSHIGGDIELKLQQFTISDFKAAAPIMLGFKDWDEMSQYLDSQDDTVNAVIDMEAGIF